MAGAKVLALAPGQELSDEKLRPLGGALALVLLALALIEWTARESTEAMSRRPQVAARLAAGVVMAGLALLGGGLDLILLVALIALVLAVLVVLDVAQRLQQGGRQSAATE